MVRVNSSSPHLVKQGQCLEGLVGMGLLGEEGSPGDHILGPITGSCEQRHALVNVATLGIQAEEPVEEGRDGGAAVGGDLGVYLGDMSDVPGL